MPEILRVTYPTADTVRLEYNYPISAITLKNAQLIDCPLPRVMAQPVDITCRIEKRENSVMTVVSS